MKWSLLIMLVGVMNMATTCAKDNPGRKMKETDPNSAQASQKSEFQHVREDLYNTLISHIEKNKITAKYWVLYSSSGWGTDYGQFEVADNGSDKITVKYDYKGKKGVLKLDNNGKVAELIAQAQDWETLEHLSPPIFDAYKYTFFRFNADDGKITMRYKLFANAPDLEGTDSVYMKIVKAFQDLIPEDNE